jgi:hypothetical protein
MVGMAADEKGTEYGEKGGDARAPRSPGKYNLRQKHRNCSLGSGVTAEKLVSRFLDLTDWHQEKREKTSTKAVSY